MQYLSLSFLRSAFFGLLEKEVMEIFIIFCCKLNELGYDFFKGMYENKYLGIFYRNFTSLSCTFVLLQKL